MMATVLRTVESLKAELVNIAVPEELREFAEVLIREIEARDKAWPLQRWWTPIGPT